MGDKRRGRGRERKCANGEDLGEKHGSGSGKDSGGQSWVLELLVVLAPGVAYFYFFDQQKQTQLAGAWKAFQADGHWPKLASRGTLPWKSRICLLYCSALTWLTCKKSKLWLENLRRKLPCRRGTPKNCFRSGYYGRRDISEAGDVVGVPARYMRHVSRISENHGCLARPFWKERFLLKDGCSRTKRLRIELVSWLSLEGASVLWCYAIPTRITLRSSGQSTAGLQNLENAYNEKGTSTQPRLRVPVVKPCHS